MTTDEILSKGNELTNLIDYQMNSIVSKVLLKKKNGNVTLFAFWGGQELSEHTSPYDAMVICLDGKGSVFIDGNENVIQEGDAIIMPSNHPHSVKANENFKMLLIMIKD